MFGLDGYGLGGAAVSGYTMWKGIMSLAAMLLSAGLHAQTVEYIHTDALGTPIAVTDANRVVIERSEYEPYGKLLNRPLTDGPGFTGHVQDAATGLTYMQQRYFDPGIGRFLSVDPVTANSGTGANFNRYWYANNNPYKFTDPDGRIACKSMSQCYGIQTVQVNALARKGSGMLAHNGRDRSSAQPPKASSSASQNLNSSSAWEHYKGGSGTPLRMNFGDIDTSSVKPSDFKQVNGLIGSERNGAFAIDSRKAFSTSGDQALFLGNITLRLQGTLTLDPSSYSFKGTLKSFDDVYDFNGSTHRSVLGEILTRAGSTQSGAAFDIEIRGSKSIDETGGR